MYRAIRHAATAILVSLAVASCSTNNTVTTDDSPHPTTEPTTSSASTNTTVTTTTVAVTTTTAPSYELVVWTAPADGQWFEELPIPWVFPLWPSEADPPSDFRGVPSASGWVRQEATVTVNEIRTQTQWCDGCFDQQGSLLMWRTVNGEGEGDPYDWEIGENLVVFEATFADGTVVRESRVFSYDPSLDAFTGWMVALDQDSPSVTFAAATFASAEEDDTDIGDVTSVVEYPIRSDAAFILLEPESFGQPPASVVGFDEFVRLLAASETGCPPSDEPWENPCFFASGPGTDFLSPPDQPGYPFIIYITEEGEVQQLEQTWSP